MADYTRPGGQRFFIRGLQLVPMDAVKPDHVGYLRNIRSYQEGTIQPRYGLNRLSAGADAPAHSPMRLNDGTSFATFPALRFLGAGTKLYNAQVGGAYVQIDSGYSGDPLSGVVAAPSQSPQPWLYIADRTRTRKVSTGSIVAPDGVPQPSSPAAEPTALLNTLQILPLENNTALATWAAVGFIASAPAAVGRVNTIASSIVYDSGNTGPVTIVPADFTNITTGSRFTLGTPDEDITVAEIHPAVGSTTVAAVIFDAGATGLCTIQPVTSLAVGQIEAPTFDEAQRRYNPASIVPPATPALMRVIDFAVNSLVSINGGTPVRVLSTATGIDGVMSFRCNSPVAITAGHTIVGVASFRSTTSVTHAAGAQILALVLQQTLTAATATDPVVGGVQLTAINGGIVDASQITLGPTPRATLPDDDIVLSFKASLLSYITEVRFYLNVDAVSKDFLTNYYFHAWRGNDLVSAIQSINAAVTQTVQDARQNVATQGNVDSGKPEPGSTWVPPERDPDTGKIITRGYWVGPVQDPATGRAVPRQSAAAAAGSDAIGLTATSRQLALGNNQWIQLRCKVRDLIRVGMDTTRTLAHVNAIQLLVQIEGITTPITVQYADFYLAGGFGPDARETLEPYSYCYRRRSSTTGAKSNPSPPSRTGVAPRRQRVTCQGIASTDATIDLDDWFKRGGRLTGWTYFGTAPTGQPINDDVADTAIEGGETLRLDLFQPWPIADKPRTGTCTVAGTAILRTAGDTFDTSWAPYTAIIVNGRTGTLYASPGNANFLQTNENLGYGAGLTFVVPEPIRLGQPLPAHWGGEVNGVVVRFACGDPTDPGALHWTHGNDPDATSDANWLYVTTTPLQHGGIYNNRAFVFSTDDLYVIVPTFGQITTYQAERTPCGRGLWSRWAFCIGRKGIYFLAKDGIYRTTFDVAEELSAPDLAPLFPNDGTNGETTRGIVAPDMTQVTRLRLSAVDGMIYFDYRGIDGKDYTLIFDEEREGWWFDRYDASGIVAREAEKGAAVEDQILVAVNGSVYQYDQTKLLDDGTAISWEVWPAHFDAGDARLMKQWGDLIVDAVPGEGYTVLPVYDNGFGGLTAVPVLASALRLPTIIDLSTGYGVLSQNFGVQISGAITVTGNPRTLLYLWEPAFVPKQTIIARRATDWEDLGYKGAKFIQGIVIRANTYNVKKLVELQYEGGHVGMDFTLLHNGETQYAYPLEKAGWTPFVAELVRLVGADANPWLLYDWRWVWEPAPEAATHWQTQETTFDLPGFLSVRDAVIAYQAHCPVILTVWHENGSQTYTLPTTNDLYARYYQPLIASKGKWVRFRLTANSPFRLFAKDTKVRVQGWGMPGGYMGTIPFGGPHRETGAAI
jgi:hypothetical protein